MALNKTRADVLLIGIADHCFKLAADALSGAVTLLGFRWSRHKFFAISK
jgi:hypothetical protein